MARLLARQALAGLWLLVALASAVPEPGDAARRQLSSPDAALAAARALPATLAEAKGPAANGTNETERLQAKIAWLKKELKHEEWRIESARSSAAKAEGLQRAKEEEAKRVRAETENATARANQTWREVAKVQAQIKAIRSSMEQQEGPVVAWVSELPHQQAIAVLLGLAGLLSIVGPSSFTRAFLAITGSAVSGLLVASCCDFFFGGFSWLGSVRNLLKGTAIPVGYGLWAIIFATGVSRWLISTKCGTVHSIDADGAADGGASGSSLQRPLLATEDNSPARRPSSRQRGARSGGAARGGVPRDAV